MKYLKVIYNGNDVTSKIQGCSDGYCKLETFIETFLPTTMFEDDDAYDRECANYDVHLNSKLIALAVACLNKSKGQEATQQPPIPRCEEHASNLAKFRIH